LGRSFLLRSKRSCSIPDACRRAPPARPLARLREQAADPGPPLAPALTRQRAPRRRRGPADVLAALRQAARPDGGPDPQLRGAGDLRVAERARAVGISPPATPAAFWQTRARRPSLRQPAPRATCAPACVRALLGAAGALVTHAGVWSGGRHVCESHWNLRTLPTPGAGRSPPLAPRPRARQMAGFGSSPEGLPARRAAGLPPWSELQPPSAEGRGGGPRCAPSSRATRRRMIWSTGGRRLIVVMVDARSLCVTTQCFLCERALFEIAAGPLAWGRCRTEKLRVEVRSYRRPLHMEMAGG
jgi:hypothetical protein